MNSSDFLPDKPLQLRGFRKTQHTGPWGIVSAKFKAPLPELPKIGWSLIQGIVMVIVGLIAHHMPMTWMLLPMFGMTQINTGTNDNDSTGDLGPKAWLQNINQS